MKQGRLIVIEGIDGSGKTTQVELLKEYLASQGLALQVISFPRYEDNIYGRLIKRYLEGEFGDISEVNPYLVALAFAGDRLLAKPLIAGWLSEGKIVIANRYVSANKAHMGANLPESKREEFISWLDALEYKTNGMPKEDLTILLKVDPKIAQKNIVNTGPDIHEENLGHLEAANKIYLELSETETNWQVVDCMEVSQMKSPQLIHQQVMLIVNDYLNSLK